MEKIYEKGHEVHVGGYVVYGHTDGKVYGDAAHTVPVAFAELKAAFMLGRLFVMENDVAYAAVQCTADHVLTVTGDSTATMKQWVESAEKA